MKTINWILGGGLLLVIFYFIKNSPKATAQTASKNVSTQAVLNQAVSGVATSAASSLLNLLKGSGSSSSSSTVASAITVGSAEDVTPTYDTSSDSD